MHKSTQQHTTANKSTQRHTATQQTHNRHTTDTTLCNSNNKRIAASNNHTTLQSAELSRSSKVSDRRRNTPKSAQNRSESLCAGLWVPCRIFWVWFDPALCPNPVRTRRFSGRILHNFRGAFSSAEYTAGNISTQ